jgi:hypothetical protein
MLHCFLRDSPAPEKRLRPHAIALQAQKRRAAPSLQFADIESNAH